ncbi:MerR family transcriptional regulator [Streptomyces gobiensis]|uniref:MerR family transcriptional regulator n=1 Tax=Streptomyces gobiensis TaxID=2875706 RepID=UPI001E35D284|nr:MerR family transcriptional regulator [Streptomyces gobiensis]UGY95033.1 MerR family transcriptional regulator [Streptomyces gobiensis]
MRGEQRLPLMTVGELSRRTGVSIKVLRQYTDWGLIYTAGRSAANYRLFDSDALWCVRWIGTLRGLGLTVAEVRELTTAYLDGAGESFGRSLEELLGRSRERLTQRIAAQQQMLRRIDEFEAEHQADLAASDVCWAGDPRCAAGA